MAVIADRVIVELEAKLDRYTANVKAAEARFDAASRNVQRSARQMEQSITRSTGAIGNQLRSMAGAIGAAFTVQQVARLTDQYTRFTNQLRVAGVEGAALGRTQNDLFGIAQRYGVELESLGTLYSRGSQSAKELGASQADLLQFTTGVAAALKVQGGSAASAQGALLQLSQALGSGTVRAEEFNSINEGALPILQAVAKNLDAAGGSVAKLKTLVNDGKVSSDAFFRAFLKGTADLEAQASKAGLTIAASFTILNNALGKYIGEADSSLSATERVSGAIISLSNNLDTVAGALGLISAVLLGRFIAGMVAAATTTGVLSTALFAMQARAVGAATTMEALALTGATAGRSLLAAFGGPVGAAVAALSVGIYYLATASNDAEQAAKDLDASISAQAEKFGLAASSVLATAAATNQLNRAQTLVLQGVAALTGEVDKLSNAWARVAAAAKAAAIEQAKATLSKARSNLIEARQQSEVRKEAFNKAARRPFAERGLGGQLLPTNPREAIRASDRAAAADPAQAELEARARANLRAAEAELKRVQNDPLAKFRPPDAAPAATKPGPKKKEKEGPKGPDPDEVARRFADDLARGNAEYQAALADATGTVQARAQQARLEISTEHAIRQRAIEADEDLTAAQRLELKALNDKIENARYQALDAAEREQVEADALELAAADVTNKRDLLELQADLATTTDERRAKELELLDLQYDEEKIRLEAIEANGKLRDAEREAARRRIKQLNEMKAAEKEGVNRRYEGVGARYTRSLNAADINEQLDEVRVRGLQSLEDKLVDVTAKIFKMGGAFGDVANQIISDLIRIGIQRAIIAPLANALFGGEGGKGGGGLIGGIVSSIGQVIRGPRASGGHVSPGGVYPVNERQIEGFKPAGSGQIVPLGPLPPPAPPRQTGGGDIYIPVTVSAPGANAQTVELIRQTIADATPTLIQAAQRATMRNLGRRRIT